jgi:menaquinone-9 beta-reductase
MRRDPLIIGAGPAGAAAAIVLARNGLRPLLLERSTGPTDKVCGDFLSGDTINRCQALGVDPAALGAAPIRRVRVMHRHRTAECALPFPALGLSRRLLDAALVQQAEKSGAQLRYNETVRRMSRHRGHWIVQCASGELQQAEAIFLATGKHDLRDLPRPQTRLSAVGMKMYFKLRPEAWRALADTVALVPFRGGYAGIQQVENGRATVCIAVQNNAFRALGGSWSALLGAAMNDCRQFANLLLDAEPLLTRPLAVARVPYGHQVTASGDDRLFRLGDQVAVIPSLTGDGMAIALHSGQTAASVWIGGGDASVYHRQIARTLGAQMRFAGFLHRTIQSAGMQALGMRVIDVFPTLLRFAAERTRLPRLDAKRLSADENVHT